MDRPLPPSAPVADADATSSAERVSIETLIASLGRFEGFPDRAPQGNVDVREPFDTLCAATDRESVLVTLTGACGDLMPRFGVRHLSVFGSAARDQLRPDSDVDVLVEFDGRASFERYFGLKDRLEDLLGRRIDLVTVGSLKPRAQQQVERDLIRVA